MVRVACLVFACVLREQTDQHVDTRSIRKHNVTEAFILKCGIERLQSCVAYWLFVLKAEEAEEVRDYSISSVPHNGIKDIHTCFLDALLHCSHIFFC